MAHSKNSIAPGSFLPATELTSLSSRFPPSVAQFKYTYNSSKKAVIQFAFCSGVGFDIPSANDDNYLQTHAFAVCSVPHPFHPNGHTTLTIPLRFSGILGQWKDSETGARTTDDHLLCCRHLFESSLPFYSNQTIQSTKAKLTQIDQTGVVRCPNCPYHAVSCRACASIPFRCDYCMADAKNRASLQALPPLSTVVNKIAPMEPEPAGVNPSAGIKRAKLEPAGVPAAGLTAITVIPNNQTAAGRIILQHPGTEPMHLSQLVVTNNPELVLSHRTPIMRDFGPLKKGMLGRVSLLTYDRLFQFVLEGTNPPQAFRCGFTG